MIVRAGMGVHRISTHGHELTRDRPQRQSRFGSSVSIRSRPEDDLAISRVVLVSIHDHLAGVAILMFRSTIADFAASVCPSSDVKEPCFYPIPETHRRAMKGISTSGWG